jgi:hemerythrin-like domain-containing protein
MTEAPADVTMMYLLHDAMRRDLDRVGTGLARLAVRPEASLRIAIGRCWAEFAANMHHHHASEDTKVWPVLRQRFPAAGALLAAMESEHAVVGPAMNDAGTAVRRHDRQRRAPARPPSRSSGSSA